LPAFERQQRDTQVLSQSLQCRAVVLAGGFHDQVEILLHLSAFTRLSASLLQGPSG
jgi:hypothetical protein